MDVFGYHVPSGFPKHKLLILHDCEQSVKNLKHQHSCMKNTQDKWTACFRDSFSFMNVKITFHQYILINLSLHLFVNAIG